MLSLKGLIGIVFLSLILASVPISQWKPDATPSHQTPLVWTTSTNPERPAAVQRFNELHPELYLRLDTSNSGMDKVLVQSSSGVGPDLFDVHRIAELQAYVEAGIALDLTPHAEEWGIDAHSALWPAIHGEHIYEGRQYGYSAGIGVDVILFNKILLKEFGVEPPEDGMTWEEFMDLARRVTGTLPGGTKHVFGVAGLAWHHFFYSQRGEYFSPDGIDILVDSPAMKLAMRMHRQAVFHDRITPSSIELALMAGQGGFGGGTVNHFGQGNFAMMIGGKWTLSQLRQFVRSQRHARERWEQAGRPGREPMVLTIGAVRLPRFQDHPPSYHARSHIVAINRLSPNKMDALHFLRYLSSQEYSQFVVNLPGNPTHVDAVFGTFPEPELADEELTRASIESMEYGYQPRTSPFLLMTDVERVIQDQVARLEADPSLSIDALLQHARKRLEQLMERNLSRDPRLREEYERRMAIRASRELP